MSDDGFTILLHPVRRQVLLPYLRQIGLALSGLTIAPMLVAARRVRCAGTLPLLRPEC